jgi:hypothetical protein
MDEICGCDGRDIGRENVCGIGIVSVTYQDDMRIGKIAFINWICKRRS